MSRPSRDGRDARTANGDGDRRVDDLGTQLEDLITHVFRCERWARLDDQIALSVDIESQREGRGSH